MSIRPVEFHGIVQRSQDVSTLKQNEDNKPMLQQQNVQTQFELLQFTIGQFFCDKKAGNHQNNSNH